MQFKHDFGFICSTQGSNRDDLTIESTIYWISCGGIRTENKWSNLIKQIRFQMRIKIAFRFILTENHNIWERIQLYWHNKPNELKPFRLKTKLIRFNSSIIKGLIFLSFLVLYLIHSSSALLIIISRVPEYYSQRMITETLFSKLNFKIDSHRNFMLAHLK